MTPKSTNTRQNNFIFAGNEIDFYSNQIENKLQQTSLQYDSVACSGLQFLHFTEYLYQRHWILITNCESFIF